MSRSEGDSDELIVQKAYMSQNGGILPIQKGVEVISVGTAFLRFLEIADKIEKKVVVVTDNDGNTDAVENKYSAYLGKGEKTHIKICFDKEIDQGDLTINDKPFNYNTLEPKIIKVNNNNLEKFNTLFNKNFANIDELHKYMNGNKTECALKIFESPNDDIMFPSYILDAINNDEE